MKIMYVLTKALLFLSLALSGQQSKGKPMQVEVDVFSGRPNPAWNLSDQEASQFQAKFKSLATSESQKPLYDGLGYRGFKVIGFQDYDRMTIWNGHVEARRGDKTLRWRDPEKSLEKYLLTVAKKHVDEGVYHVIEAQINHK
jgi:hypothetical protein